ncbi:MAG TPA: DNA-directed RNA polymerase subunit omega [Bacteroidales bacterium]|nr:DNA-directed RNA polymerase subunit omega [Bacteroidales bacterium]
MDYKRIKTDTTAVTRRMGDFSKDTGNIYETIVIISKRANQIALEMRDELKKKIDEFATNTTNLEEVFENREQIEISKYYERLPKPSLIAVQEYLDGQIYYRNPSKEKEKEKAESTNNPMLD